MEWLGLTPSEIFYDAKIELVAICISEIDSASI